MKKKFKRINFLDKESEIVESIFLSELVFKDSEVIKLSISMFSDPEPCILHKTYVMRQMMIDIDDYINKNNLKEFPYKDKVKIYS